MLIVWAQLPQAGCAVPQTWLPQQLPTQGLELGTGSVAAGEELKCAQGCLDPVKMVSSLLFFSYGANVDQRKLCCLFVCTTSAFMHCVDVKKQG